MCVCVCSVYLYFYISHGAQITKSKVELMGSFDHLVIEFCTEYYCSGNIEMGLKKDTITNR